MRLVILPLLLFAFSVSLTAQETDHVPGELMIQFKPGYDLEDFQDSFLNYDLKSRQLLSKRMNIWLFTFDSEGTDETAVLFDVKQHSMVKAAQYNHYVDLRRAEEIPLSSFQFDASTFPDDQRFNEQWALHNTGQSGGLADADIDAPEAWDLSTGGLTVMGDTIVIAIVDGGCQLNHPDLNYWFNWSEIPNNGIDDDNNGYIDDFRGWNAYNNNGNVPSDGHGTHVSGISGAHGNNSIGVSGVNWLSKIMPVAGSSGVEATVVAAYGYILEMRARYNETNGSEGAFIVSTNASFGVDYGQPANYPLWCGIYDSLGMQGVLNCGATANLNINIDVTGDIPTACPSLYMIAVTNTTRNDTKNNGAAYGLTTIDLGSPGTDILSTYTGGGYTSLTGTSMATPHVTGAIALMFAEANLSILTAYKNNPASGALIFRELLLEGTDPLSSLQGITVTGGRLNIYNALLAVSVPPDTIPPAAVNDLAVIDTTSNSLTISWTTPLDTSKNGVVAYDIRISNSPITDSTSFYNAQQLEFTDIPDTAGAVEVFTADSLNFNTLYYFALKSMDRWGNLSAVSNSPSGRTFEAPQISVAPLVINKTVNTDTLFSDSVIVSNISANTSTLSYSVEMENMIYPEGSLELKLIPVKRNIPAGSKDQPGEFYGSSFDGAGGPDMFGYEWIDSDEPNGPEYVWNDIASTGSLVNNWIPTGVYSGKDEGYAGPFSLGFNFDFYGVTKNEVFISSNGFALFNTLNVNTFTNAQIPSSNIPNGFIAPFWADLDGSNQGTVHYKQDGSKFIIQFTGWQTFYGTSTSLTFQIVLHSNGKILYYYNNMNADLNSAVVGIENFEGNDGLQVAYHAPYIHNNLAVMFSAAPDWIAASGSSGLLYNGNSAAIVLTFMNEGFPIGTYSLDLNISSNDPVNPVITIPVTLNITAIPVELVSFTAEQNKNSVKLSWITATETNNYGFEIERSKGNSNWTNIGFVKGSGSTVDSKVYLFFDKGVAPGKHNYRIKQVDLDGTFEYSGSIEVTIDVPSEFSLSQNYPNPFNPLTYIEFALPEKSRVNLKIYSALGELISELMNSEKEAGYYKEEFNSYDLPSGFYIYQLTVKGESQNYISTKKMILLK